MKVRVIAAIGAMTMGLAACGATGPSSLVSPTPSRTVSESNLRSLIREDSLKPRFDGVVGEWRVAPYRVLDREGVAERDLALDCEPGKAAANTTTNLDFTLGYTPQEPVRLVEARPAEKTICGDDGLSVYREYRVDTLYGPGSLQVSRFLWGHRSITLFASVDRVEPGTVQGMPAILVHPIIDETGQGQTGEVIVIEDDQPPEFRVLRIVADGVPWPELIKIAEGISR